MGRGRRGSAGDFERADRTATPPDQGPSRNELDELKKTAASMEQRRAQVERSIENHQTGKASRSPRPKPVVSAEQCTGCGICLDICPAEAILVVNGTATISDDCVGCGVCVAECPNGALSLA